MYDELVKELRDSAEWADRLALLMGRAEGDTHAPIMRKAADVIEELQKAVNFHKFNSGFWEDKYNSLADEKWIPVTERLPEIEEKHHCSKDVLAYLKDGEMCFTALEENIFGQACFECERNPAVEEEMIVTHWMPLPEPPKEET